LIGHASVGADVRHRPVISGREGDYERSGVVSKKVTGPLKTDRPVQWFVWRKLIF
jgi:hypothetical protein